MLHLQVYLVLSASPHPTTSSGSLEVYSVPRLLLLLAAVPSGPALPFEEVVIHPNITQLVVHLAGYLRHTTCCGEFKTPMDSLAAHYIC